MLYFINSLSEIFLFCRRDKTATPTSIPARGGFATLQSHKAIGVAKTPPRIMGSGDAIFETKQSPDHPGSCCCFWKTRTRDADTEEIRIPELNIYTSSFVLPQPLKQASIIWCVDHLQRSAHMLKFTMGFRSQSIFRALARLLPPLHQNFLPRFCARLITNNQQRLMAHYI